jgi:SAM-dependent methyltransferase
VFQTYSKYYDLLYRDKDYHRESEYIVDVLSRFGFDGKHIMEFGSGTGKHANILTELGFHVSGIEKSADMIAQANVNDMFSLMQGDIRNIRLGYQFDAVLSLFHVMSYQIENEDVHSVFSNASLHLKPGGLFVFDVWFTPAVYTIKPTVRIKKLGDSDTEIVRVAEPQIDHERNVVDVSYTIFVKNKNSGNVDVVEEKHTLRHFSSPEISLFAEYSGFKMLGSEEFLTKKKPGDDTWGVCFILQKI